MRVLGIETSCDDTGVALYDSREGLIAHLFASQLETHRPYGGVVPELAARDHIRLLTPLIEQLRRDTGGEHEAIDAIGYTAGPGLAGALLVGASVAQGLAMAWQVPVVPVHHMEGHLMSIMLEEVRPDFPFLGLLVSGGHTMLVQAEAFGCYRILGESLDDAVGEAFDKTAKLLGLGYPGGPVIAARAAQGRADKYRFPRPMTDRPGLDFSFSGLKTYAMNHIEAVDRLDDSEIADIALAFETAVVDTLVIKCRRALRQTGLKELVVAGGVAANKQLRDALASLARAETATVYFPSMQYCTDNGAMIAYVALMRQPEAQPAGPYGVRPRWSLDELSPVATQP